MSVRLNAILCFPHGTLKSTTGVCLVVFLPSIQTSAHGIELIVIEQSAPPPPESSEATALRVDAGASSPVASAPSSLVGASRWRRRLPPPGEATAVPPPGAAMPVPVPVPVPPVGAAGVPPPATFRGSGGLSTGGDGGAVGLSGVGAPMAISRPGPAGGDAPSGAGLPPPPPAGPPIVGIRVA